MVRECGRRNIVAFLHRGARYLVFGCDLLQYLEAPWVCQGLGNPGELSFFHGEMIAQRKIVGADCGDPMTIPYFHVDAFTGELFAGNPAGVCLLTGFLTSELMQKIAAENRHSETAFVVERTDRDFDLRWFTPAVEDDLCGHATLASAYVLAHRGHARWPVRFHTCSGVLSVAKAGELFELDFPARPAEPCEPLPGLLEALGLPSDSLVMKAARDYLVVLPDAEQVRRLKPDIAALGRLALGIGGAIVTAPGEDDVDYVVRFFPPSVGIPEDPATGSIQCTLAPFWAKRLGETRFHAQQLSARGGEMWTEVSGDRVKIAGKARMYLQGSIDI